MKPVTDPIALRCILHRGGKLMSHVAEVGQYWVVVYQCPQAASSGDGSWYLFIGIVGNPLRWRRQHQSLGDARQFAADVIAAAGTDATHEQIGAYWMEAALSR